jgi:hypothetical protein
MTKRISLPAITTALMLTISVVTLAVTTIADLEIFDSEIIKELKVKFREFAEKSKQDRLYLQTDKAFYKPGETVWFTAYVRDETTLKASAKSDIVHVELITPKGSVEKHIKVVSINGSARGDFDLSAHPGGIYKIKAYAEWQKNDKTALLFEKEIQVQSSVMPRLKMKIDFEKRAYGKGDEVIAKLELNTNENKPLASTTVKFNAKIDGKEILNNKATTDENGKTQIKFLLPKDLSSIDGVLNSMIDFEGSTESISRSIPIVLNKISMEFFPEGGDMVSEVPSRVAFKAVNEFSKAADIEGIVVDSKGAIVTKFSSYHFGMGAFDFVPKKNETYRARITKPEGILDEFSLPEALAVGYVLKADAKGQQAILITVHSWKDEALSLIAQTRGAITYSGSFNAIKGKNTFQINCNDFPIGISQITLFDSKGIARAERLVFVNRTKQLKINVTAEKQQYRPREKVTINIRATDENGLPVQGKFSMAVIDDNLLSFADDKQGNILSKILLEPDLKQKVEEANFYFDTKEEKSLQALDYLMMTSGWRKYTWKQIEEGDFPSATYNAEKAEWSGVIFDGYTYKPLPGATVKFKENGRSIVTGSDGKFLFRKFDIAAVNQVEISAPNHNTTTVTINNYSANNRYYLYDNRNRYEYMADAEAMPLAVGGVAEERVVVKEMKAVATVTKAAPKPLAKAENINAMRDWADAEEVTIVQQKKDLIQLPIEEPAQEADDETKIQKGKAGDLRGDMLGNFDKRANQQKNNVQFYRAKEFPKRTYSANDSTRNDFGTTAYWNGNITTDRSGKAKIEFVANDLISSFKATVEGFGDEGSIGRAEYNYSTNQPLVMDAKIPTEMVTGDKMMIPLFVKNNTSATVNGKILINAPVQLQITLPVSELQLAPNESKVIWLQSVATQNIGEGKMEVKLISQQFGDALSRTINVVAKGFPVNIALSGQDLQKEFFVKPQHVVPGSLKVSFNAYPNVMSELMSGVESILREPYGCFEQTSSSNYPNIMALQYLKTMKVNEPKLEARAKQLLDAGYKKLVAFETKEKGYEWFGAAPAHEALTAYGLMEFEDMKSVYSGVDQNMINRTAALLLEKRDGNGGFKKNPRALDSFGGADEDITNAYIVYALSEAGRGKEIQKELDAAARKAKAGNDPYMLALVANALFNTGNYEQGDEMIKAISGLKNDGGFWSGKKHSITRSTGEGLKVETTSLIALAVMKSVKPDAKLIIDAVKFLVNARSGYGGFGSTQATILALKSLTKYAEFSRKTDEAGTVEVWINGSNVASKDFAKGQTENVKLEGLERYFTEGKQQVEVRYTGCKNALPYSMNVVYNTTLPESDKNCVVALETKLMSKQVKVGETIRLSATLRNKTNEGQPMTMAIIGLPAGLSAQPWQLKEMQEKGVIDFYEIVGNNIACYYRSLAPAAQKQINLDLKAEIPGQYEAPASSAYLYYTAENKHWVNLGTISIQP